MTPELGPRRACSSLRNIDAGFARSNGRAAGAEPTPPRVIPPRSFLLPSVPSPPGTTPFAMRASALSRAVGRLRWPGRSPVSGVLALVQGHVCHLYGRLVVRDHGVYERLVEQPLPGELSPHGHPHRVHLLPVHARR